MISKQPLTHLKSTPKRRRLKLQSISPSVGEASSRKIPRFFSPAWLACIPLTAIIVLVWHSAVAAQNPPITEITAPTASISVAEVKGLLNTVWVLIAAILVIFMNAGFAMLETGFCRQKNAVNILSKNLMGLALSTLAFWALGFSLMFGTQGKGFAGWGGLFLSSADAATYGLKLFPEGLPIPVFFLFQVALAGIAATIVAGAVAERIKFVDFLLFSLLLVGIAYPITGHWIWAKDLGWLNQLGFKDFAGSTVVHSVGGWAALAGAAILGPRTGKYSERRINALPGHNMSMATLGCLILWIGWIGFNSGSVLGFTTDVPYIALTTNLAAAAGGIAAMLTAWLKDGKPDLSMIINGILAGLVAITAGCNGVSYPSAIIIGAIAGAIVVYCVAFFDSLRIDDPVGVISVHLVCGIWGTLAVGIFTFAENEAGQKLGLIYGGGFGQIFTQIIGIVAVGAFTLIFSVIAWTILKVTLGIRVTLEEEINGLDVGEHGMEAYSGFVKEADLLFGSRRDINESDLPSRSGK